MKNITQRTANRFQTRMYGLLITLIISVSGFSQNVGINATGAQPNAAAGLDVDFTNKGLLIPRVSLASTTSFAPLTAHVAGMVVYNTATTADVTPGFYCDNGSKWIPGFIKGQSLGDMLYWNGTDWLRIPIGVPGQYLQVSGTFVPTWGGNIFSTLSTTAASSITGITATSGGNITSDGGSSIVMRGVCWKATPGATIADSKTSDGSGSGTFVSNLTGLLPVTTYYVRAYAINNTVVNYGNEISFTTLPVLPTLAATAAATAITGTTATSGGNVTATGGASITERGICFGLTINPTIADTKVIDQTPGLGTFVSNLTGLVGNTTYHVRAYATNSAGTAYGTDISFTTLKLAPTLVTTAASAITGTGATSGGSATFGGGGYSYGDRGVAYSTVPNSPSPTFVSIGFITTFPTAPWVTNLTGLQSNTTYYIRSYLNKYDPTAVWGTPAWSTDFGNELSFTTTGPSAPVVGTTSAITGISANTAVSGGTITSDGGSPITAKGVCWSTSTNPVLGVGNFTTDGTGTTSFTSNITGLASNTTYYVRAYATNGVTTSYSPASVSFTTWVQAPYTLGQVLSYGIVGYIAPDGSGFIVSPEIPSLNGWGCNGINVTGTSTALGTGQANTAAILACSVGTTTAASVASSYNGGGFNDWYLPSSGDWAQIAQNYYWYGLYGNKMYYTSSQYGTNYNYASAYFNTGSQAYATGLNRVPSTNDLSLMNGIRAIRNFAAATLPTVTTTAISNIGGGSATGGGNVTNDGGATVTAYGVCWSTSTGPTVALATKTVDGTGTGVFASTIAGLNPGTTYHVRAYATSIAGTAYGTEVSFTTSVATAPIVSTDPISGAGGTVATCGGNVTSDGGAAVTARGICWGTSTAPTTALTTKTSDGTGIGVFVSSLTGLTVGTTYYVRAYATNSVGTTYGNEVNFTQPGVGLPTVSTTPITNIYASTASSGVDVTGDGGSAVTAAGICWSTTPGPDIALPTTTSTFAGSGIGNFASNLFGLLPTTTYYVRAYATNANGTSYGSELSFTTSSASAPIITTDPVINLIGSLAEGGGTLTSDGGSALSAVGVCWGNSVNPTITSNLGLTNESQYLGSFAPFTYFSNMNNLSIGTTYHVRAYATNGLGTSYGTDVSFVATAATLGQTVSGGLMWGYVFSVDGTGLHGLIADMWGYGTADWGCTSTVTGASGTAIGTGMANTTAIINDITTNACVSASPMLAFAAQVCKYNGIDWYLPSKDELNLLWANQNADITGGLSGNLNSALLTAPFWSSSEVNATDVWNFDGTTWLNTGLKTAQNIVWPIRSF